VLGGLLVGAAIAPVFGGVGVHLVLFLAAAALSAPLPDVDHPGSMYGRFIPLPSVAKVYGRLEPFRRGPEGNDLTSFGQVGWRVPGGILWHRGPTHSLLAAAVVTLLAWLVAGHFAPALALPVAAGVGTGYLSHLALDELNVAGEKLLWPLRRTVRLPWPSFKVGSVWEALTAVVMVAAIVLLVRPEIVRVLP